MPRNTLNRRPRGMSIHNTPATGDDISIIPNFLRRLSRTPMREEDYDRAEKMMTGSSVAYSNGNTHRYSASSTGIPVVGKGPRRRIFTIMGAILFVLTGLYFFLPWAPSLSSPFGIPMTSLLICRITFITAYEILLETFRFIKATRPVCAYD